MTFKNIYQLFSLAPDQVVKIPEIKDMGPMEDMLKGPMEFKFQMFDASDKEIGCFETSILIV